MHNTITNVGSHLLDSVLGLTGAVLAFAAAAIICPMPYLCAHALSDERWLTAMPGKQLLPMPNAEIVGVVDPSPPAIAATRARFTQLADTPAFAGWNEALSGGRGGLDVGVTEQFVRRDEIDVGCERMAGDASWL